MERVAFQWWSKPHRTSILRDVRVLQVKAVAKLLRVAGLNRLGRAALIRIRRTRSGTTFLDAVLGYHRVFKTLKEAEEAVQPYANRGHQFPDNANFHLRIIDSLRTSDYAALLHLTSRIAKAKLIFDLGGNVGNLFYSYEKYLDFPQTLVWKVYDLPDHIRRGAALAAERKAHHLHFTDRWSDASGADVLLASGSLHYFSPLAQLIEQLPQKPQSILINRTPLIDGPSVAVVQDSGRFRVACMLYNRTDLIADLERIGYRLADTWQAAELSIDVPGSPDHRVQAYSGLWFKRRCL